MIALAGFFLVLAAALILSLESTNSIARVFTPIHPVLFQIGQPRLLAIAESVLQAQASLAALSFPIALAFAALSQDKEQRTTGLEIYFVESAVLVLAISSLLLIVTSALLPFVLTLAAKVRVRPFFCFVMAGYVLGWLSINILLTVRFTIKTFEFLGKAGRRKFFVDFAVQAVRSRDVLAFLMRTLYREDMTRSRHAWLAVDEQVEKSIYEPIVIRFRGRQQLIDVKRRKLAWGLDRWRRRVGSEAPAAVLAELNFGETDDEWVAARLPKSHPPSRLERYLISTSFAFESAGRSASFLEYPEYVATILSEARLAFLRSDRVDFEYHLETVAELIRGAVGTGYDRRMLPVRMVEVIDSIPASSNIWDLLRPTRHFDRDLLLPAAGRGNHEWHLMLVKELLSLASSDLLTKGNSWTITRDLFQYLVALNIWQEDHWAAVRDEQLLAGLITSKNYLGEPRRNHFRDTTFSVAGEWTQSAIYYLSWRYSKVEWGRAVLHAQPLLLHVHGVTQSFLAALRRGDIDSARLWLDVFLNWASDFSFAFASLHFLGPRELWVSSTDLGSNIGADVGSGFESGPDVVSGYKYLVLTNFWWSLRVALVAILTRERRDVGAEEVYSPFLDALISGNPVELIDDHPRLDDSNWPQATKLLAIVLRINLGQGEIENYLLDDLTRSSITAHLGPIMSGRSRGYVGSQDRDACNGEFARMIASESRQRWPDDSSTLREIFEWLRADERRKRDGIHVLQMLENSVRAQQLPDGGEQDQGARRENAADGIHRLIERIRLVDERALVDARPNPEQLDRISDICAQTAFSKESAGSTVRLFAVVEHLGFVNHGDESEVRVEGVSKAVVADAPGFDRAINESEWLASITRNFVSGRLMSSIYRKLVRTSVVAASSELYWQEVVRASAGLQEPMVLTSNETLPDWLWKWKYHRNEPLPEGMVQEAVVLLGGGSIRPFFRANGISFVKAPVRKDASLVVSPSAFRSVGFERFADGRLVNVHWFPENRDSITGTLVVKWKTRPSITDGVGTEIVFKA